MTTSSPVGAPASRVEVAAAVALVACASVYLGRFVVVAATTPLWTDELFGVVGFSSQGVAHAFTHYNHTLYDGLTALTPGPSLSAWHARLWSVLPALAVQALVLVELWGRRRRWMAGAVLFAVFATSFGWLDLVFQGRGYGLLGLAAAGATFAVWRFLEVGRIGALVVLAVMTLVGTWSIPVFILFAAPLWVAVLVARRRRWRPVVLVGAVAAAAVVVVHVPLLGELTRSFTSYAEEFGTAYDSPLRVASTFHEYLLGPSVTGVALPDVVTGVVVLALLAGPWVLRLPGAEADLGRVLTAAAAAFFVVCLLLRTPLLRTTAFVVVPVALVGVLLAAEVVRRWLPAAWRPAAAVVVSVLLSANALVQTARFSYVVRDDFPAVAEAITTRFAPGTAVHTTGNPANLALFLPASYPVRPASALPAADFAAGRAVLVDYDGKAEPRFDASRLAPAVDEQRVPQSRGQFQRILSARRS